MNQSKHTKRYRTEEKKKNLECFKLKQQTNKQKCLVELFDTSITKVIAHVDLPNCI